MHSLLASLKNKAAADGAQKAGGDATAGGGGGGSGGGIPESTGDDLRSKWLLSAKAAAASVSANEAAEEGAKEGVKMLDVFSASTGYGKMLASFEALAQKTKKVAKPSLVLVGKSQMQNATNSVMLNKAGFDVTVWTTGRDAFRHIKEKERQRQDDPTGDEESVSLMVVSTDIQQFDCRELIEFVRGSVFGEELPAVALAAPGSTDEEQRALVECGYDHVLVKPLSAHLNALSSLLMRQDASKRGAIVNSASANYNKLLGLLAGPSTDAVSARRLSSKVTFRPDSGSSTPELSPESSLVLAPLPPGVGGGGSGTGTGGGRRSSQSRESLMPAAWSSLFPQGVRSAKAVVSKEHANEVARLQQQNAELSETLMQAKDELSAANKRVEELVDQNKRISLVEKLKQSQIYRMKEMKDKEKLAEYESLRQEVDQLRAERESWGDFRRREQEREIVIIDGEKVMTGDDPMTDIGRLNEMLKEQLANADVEQVTKALEDKARALSQQVSYQRGQTVLLRKDVRRHASLLTRVFREKARLGAAAAVLEAARMAEQDRDCDAETNPFVTAPVISHTVFSGEPVAWQMHVTVTERPESGGGGGADPAAELEERMEDRVSFARLAAATAEEPGQVRSEPPPYPHHLRWARGVIERFHAFVDDTDTQVCDVFNAISEGVLATLPAGEANQKRCGFMEYKCSAAFDRVRARVEGFACYLAYSLLAAGQAAAALRRDNRRLHSELLAEKRRSEELAAGRVSAGTAAAAAAAAAAARLAAQQAAEARRQKLRRKLSRAKGAVAAATRIRHNTEEQPREEEVEEEEEEEEADAGYLLSDLSDSDDDGFDEAAFAAERDEAAGAALLSVVNPDYPDLPDSKIMYNKELHTLQLTFLLPPQVYEEVCDDTFFVTLVAKTSENREAGGVEVCLRGTKVQLSKAKRQLLERLQTMKENRRDGSLIPSAFRTRTGTTASTTRQKRTTDVTTSVTITPAPLIRQDPGFASSELQEFPRLSCFLPSLSPDDPSSPPIFGAAAAAQFETMSPRLSRATHASGGGGSGGEAGPSAASLPLPRVVCVPTTGVPRPASPGGGGGGGGDASLPPPSPCVSGGEGGVRYMSRDGDVRFIHESRVRFVAQGCGGGGGGGGSGPEEEAEAAAQRARRWTWRAARRARAAVREHKDACEERADEDVMRALRARMKACVTEEERQRHVGSMMVNLSFVTRRLFTVEKENQHTLSTLNAEWEKRYSSLFAKYALLRNTYHSLLGRAVGAGYAPPAHSSPRRTPPTGYVRGDTAADVLHEFEDTVQDAGFLLVSERQPQQQQQQQQQQGWVPQQAVPAAEFLTRTKGYYFSGSAHAAALVAALAVVCRAVADPGAAVFLDPAPPRAPMRNTAFAARGGGFKK